MDHTAPIREFSEALGINVYEIRLDVHDGNGEQPALWFQRNAFGKESAYALPLSAAYLVADADTLMECAMKCGVQLGLLKGVYSDDKATFHKIMDLLTKHIDDLVQKIPPAPVETRRDIENKIDRSGYTSFKAGGQEILH